MPKKSLFIHRIFKFLALKAIFAQIHHAQKPARIDFALAQKHASGDLHGQFVAVAMPKELIGVAWRVLTKLLGDEFTLFIRANAPSYWQSPCHTCKIVIPTCLADLFPLLSYRA